MNRRNKEIQITTIKKRAKKEPVTITQQGPVDVIEEEFLPTEELNGQLGVKPKRKPRKLIAGFDPAFGDKSAVVLVDAETNKIVKVVKPKKEPKKKKPAKIVEPPTPHEVEEEETTNGVVTEARAQKVKEVVEKSHSLFGSPSSLSRTKECPAWIAFGKNIPNPPSSAFAEEGTIFHHHMERITPMVLSGINFPLSELKVDEEKYPDMLEYIQKTADKIKEIWDGFKQARKFCEFHTELKVKINDDSEGTADLVFTGENKNGRVDIVGIDYKYGKGVPVSAYQNIQGLAYLIGTIKTLDIKKSKLGNAAFIIGQVRLDDNWENNKYVLGRFMDTDTHQELVHWHSEIVDIVAKAKIIYEKNAIEGNLKAGDHCRFCKCLSICPEVKRTRLDDLQLTTQELGDELVKQLTVEQQVEIFLRKGEIEDFLDAVAKNLTQAAEIGLEVPGLKLIQTKGRRKWIDDQEKVADTLNSIGVDPWKKTLKGITIIEKELPKGNKDALENLVQLGSGKLELVRESDKRQAIVGSKTIMNNLMELPE